MRDFLTALALVLVIEGIIYAGFPDGMKRMMGEMQRLPATTLRVFGLGAAGLGVLLVWVLRAGAG